MGATIKECLTVRPFARLWQHGRLGAILLACLFLAACSLNQQREVNSAFVSASEHRSKAAIECSKSAEVSSCMLGLAAIYGGGSGGVPPVVQSDLAAIAPVLGAVITAGAGAWSNIQQARSAERSQIAATNANAAVSINNINAFAQLGTAAVGAVGNTATQGFNSLGSLAGAGFVALERLGASGFNASAFSAGAWADMVASLPATYQLGPGAVFGNGNTLLNGIGDLDQSSTGRDRGVIRTCTGAASSAITGQLAANATGTTGPGASVGFYPEPSVPVAIDCGG